MYVYLFNKGVLPSQSAQLGPHRCLSTIIMMGTPNKMFWLPFRQPLCVEWRVLFTPEKGAWTRTVLLTRHLPKNVRHTAGLQTHIYSYFYYFSFSFSFFCCYYCYIIISVLLLLLFVLLFFQKES